ncbi:MAG: STAS domain-containing protein [Verrucomicrobiota bacterium]
MTTSTRTEESITILSIDGDIDLESSPQLRTELKKISGAKTPKLLLDFSKTTYIDSSGLATLIEYFQAAGAYQGKLGLCGLTPRVKNSFTIVRLDEVFSFYNDLTTGISALKA